MFPNQTDILYLGIIALLVIEAHPLITFDSVGNFLTVNPLHCGAFQERAGLVKKHQHTNV